MLAKDLPLSHSDDKFDQLRSRTPKQKKSVHRKQKFCSGSFDKKTPGTTNEFFSVFVILGVGRVGRSSLIMVILFNNLVIVREPE